jgi:hypothetical protein
MRRSFQGCVSRCRSRFLCRRSLRSLKARQTTQAIRATSRVLTNYVSRTETKGQDTHRPIQQPSRAVQKGQLLTRPTPARQDAAFPQARPQQATGDCHLSDGWLPRRLAGQPPAYAGASPRASEHREYAAGGLCQQPAGRIDEESPYLT